MALVEREREMTALRNSLINCVNGAGAAVLVTGGVGSGKTALLRSFAGQAHQIGALLLGAIGSPTERNREFGLLDQLLRRASLPGEVRSRLCRSGESGDAAPVHDLCLTLLDRAGDRPLVITVDDIQFADAASLEALLALHRRIGSRRVLLIFTERTGLPHERLEVQAELSRSPQFQYIQLPMLSSSGVAALLAECTDTVVTWARAADGHRITGGNPLLVRALAEDNLPLTGHRGLHIGAAFGRAVATCLLRSDLRLVRVARGCAVLEGSASPDLVASVVDLDRRSVDSCMDLLMAGGLLGNDDFRSEATRTAVLDCMSAAERERLRRRAAEMLYHAGAGARDVATYVLAAGRPAAGWEHDMLREAAEHALAGDDVATATEFLELSWRTDQDLRRRSELVPLLAQALWRANPAAAARHLGRADPVGSARHALWQGRLAWARTQVRALLEAPEPRDTSWAIELRLLCQWLYGPERAAALAGATPLGDRRDDPASVLIGARPSGARAEHVLYSCRLTHSTLEVLVYALSTLVDGGMLDRAGCWCDALLYEARCRGAATWQALFGMVRAEICLRTGDVQGSVTHGETALSRISAQSWGVLIGYPLSTLVLAATASGRHGDAVALLSRPVPEAMFGTVPGLRYLHARGQHLLAIDRASAALATTSEPGERAILLGQPVASLSVLTAAERRVATLAARGCTNSEIADRLRITSSTVEQHLTRTYRKLNVTRRTELLAVLPAARLAQSEPVELHAAAAVRADRKPA